ncbi:hypothetical protein SAMN05216337_105166 [Bradyrhizobium brasilense]|uniref:Uncharacterized protein n=1 Tax=Bradyrhizobium brasilense TaxID=1419277 RepID=A0A1G7K826_9BRAD|nr:hypothetical protein [Bradyrhizobium brasilense]SDF33210.1 hypothetical protein SAMN05216337_105166 [Bradyrhizobium brasilense]
MPLISSESWPGTAASIAGIFIVVGLGFGTVRYVEWSSDANLARFMSRTEVVEAASISILPLKGRTGCEQGNQSPSALSLPLE